MTYEEILERMRETYYQESNFYPDEISDTGIRLRVAAGELYRIQKEVDWLRRQAFPSTAEGEYLKLHGEQRGIVRREATKATGSITFTRYLPLSSDLVIPAGTVCASAGEDAVEYETTEDVVLTAGELTVKAPARAVLGGLSGNAAAGYITTMVTPVIGIQYVSNTAAFTGGTEQEEDESYRQRVLEAYARIDNGGSVGYYQRIALEVPGVYSAQTVPRIEGAGTVGIYLWGNGAAPEEQVIAQVKSEIEKSREVGVTPLVQSATTRKVNITMLLKMTSGASFSMGKQAAADAITAWFAQKKVGDGVYMADVVRAVLEAAPVQSMSMPSTMRDIAPTNGVVPVLGTLTLEEKG